IAEPGDVSDRRVQRRSNVRAVAEKRAITCPIRQAHGLIEDMRVAGGAYCDRGWRRAGRMDRIQSGLATINIAVITSRHYHRHACADGILDGLRIHVALSTAAVRVRIHVEGSVECGIAFTDR